MKIVTIFTVALALSTCAKAPSQIPAAQIEAETFATLTCDQLAEKDVEQHQLLKALSTQQKQAQAGDAVGVFLLGLPVSSMSGGDRETEIPWPRGTSMPSNDARSATAAPSKPKHHPIKHGLMPDFECGTKRPTTLDL